MMRAMALLVLAAAAGWAAGPERVPGFQPMALVSSAAPEYPRFASSHRIGAVVVLSATVRADGKVERVRVLSGPPMFRDPAVLAVSRWIYRPAMINGRPISQPTTIRLRFRVR